MKNSLRLLILSCLYLSCMITSCDKNEVVSIKTHLSSGCGQGLIPFNANDYSNLITDSLGITDIRLEQTCLIVDFAYSGCDVREVGVMAFLDYTPFVPVLRTKISSGPIDECLAFFAHTDTFDLSSTELILYDGISLKIHQWDELFVIEVE